MASVEIDCALGLTSRCSPQVDHRVKEGAWRARLLKRDDKRLMLEGEIREFVTALRSKVCAKLHFSTEFVGCLLP